jgi:hypothetical protein
MFVLLHRLYECALIQRGELNCIHKAGAMRKLESGTECKRELL